MLTFAPCKGEIHRVQIVRFVRWVYFALKRRGLVREVRLLPFVPSHYILLNRIYRSVTRSRHIHQKENLPSEIPMHSYLIQILLPCLSRSSSVGAVLYFVYKSRLTIASSLSSSLFLISGKASSISTK